MSDPEHPRDGEAAEYVLGTMPIAERDAFSGELARDPGLLAAVRAWERRLAPLSAATAPVQPSPGLWASIAGALPGVDVSGEVVSFQLARMARSRRIWRAAALAAGSLAAALAIVIGLGRNAPAPPSQQLLAVVNRSGELPALIVRVDPQAGIVQVRSLAAETPPDRSLELWSIVGGGAPRSLGLVGAAGRNASIPESDRPRLEGATIAVSVEPAGGSRTGGPTGPVVYSGKLVPDPR